MKHSTKTYMNEFMKLYEGQADDEQGDLYGIWVERIDKKPAWFYDGYLAWFTPDLRIAIAQRNTIIQFGRPFETAAVCRLGPDGEPIELVTRGE